MADQAKEIIRVNIEDEVRQSYLDYAMSVIVGRALPDVRDGLKPVHRRVLFAMQELNNVWNRSHIKCARVVGDVIGKYHPHGDQSVYDALVRMAQSFSLRYPLVDGQGNFGSVDGDSAAAMRYTECRLDRLASEVLADLDKDTVDFQPNYDEKEHEPKVMPTRVPNLLINGSAGIVEAYRTGRGRILVRAKADIELEDNGRETILVTELPYQVNKKRLIESIADLHKEKKIEGISELRDESDKDGMRIVIEVRKDTMADVLLNNLYQQTQMQVTFGINMVALIDGRPRTLSLREIIDAFIRHRREVVTRRTIFDLRKARDRAHVLEGLTVALANIDEMIELIKTSASSDEARERMTARRWEPGMVRSLLAAAGAEASKPETLAANVGLRDDGYQLSEIQAQQILEMRLNRLTGLEQEKLTDEYKALLITIADLIEILESPERLLQVIRDELIAIREQYGDERRTVIQVSQDDINILDLIEPEDVVVTMSHTGYAKRQPVTTYRAQKRGGKGRSASALKDEDFVDRLWIANTHDTLLTFTSSGRVYWLKVYQLPDAGPNARGKPIVNLLPLQEGEMVQAIQPVHEYSEDRFVLFATRKGTVKKTPLTEFEYQLAKGKIAINLDEDDALVDVLITDGDRDVMLFASNGKTVRFDESTVRATGRNSMGVRGIRLAEDAHVVSLIVVDGDGDILTATERGYGKRTPADDYPKKGRGIQGVIGIQCSKRNGSLVGAVQVSEDDGLMLISDQGTLVRTRAAEVAKVGRNTQGVTLIRLPKDEALIGFITTVGAAPIFNESHSRVVAA